MRAKFIANLESLSTSVITQFIHTIDHVVSTLGEGFDPLSAKERKEKPKLRKGGKQVIPELASMARRYGVAIPSAPVEEMTKTFAYVDQLRPLVDAVGALHTLLDDMLLVANSEGWRTARTLYRVLQGLAAENPALAKELAPVEEFFKPRAKKAKPDKTAGDTSPPPPKVQPKGPAAGADTAPGGAAQADAGAA